MPAGKRRPVEQPDAPSKKGKGAPPSTPNRKNREVGNAFAWHGEPSAVISLGVALATSNYGGLTKHVPLREQGQSHKGCPSACRTLPCNNPIAGPRRAERQPPCRRGDAVGTDLQQLDLRERHDRIGLGHHIRGEKGRPRHRSSKSSSSLP